MRSTPTIWTPAGWETPSVHGKEKHRVVDVAGFKERLVGSKISSDALHIVERFTRVDYNTINYEARGGRLGRRLPGHIPSQANTCCARARDCVFDCGQLNIADISVYQLKREEIATNLMSVPCFLIAHPRGNLMWDVGAVPDSAFRPGGAPPTLRAGTSTKTLQSQMAEIGYAPGDITHLAFSHFHWDHVGNANLFAGATWLVRNSERELMFAEPPSPRTEPANFSALRTSRTVAITTNDYDVFGDGTVVVKATPGHSPGHQVLFVKLERTGPVVLSGDLYHYPEERTLNRVPTTEFNIPQTVASSAALIIPQAIQRGALDRARFHGERENQEVARVLRLDLLEFSPAQVDGGNRPHVSDVFQRVLVQHEQVRCLALGQRPEVLVDPQCFRRLLRERLNHLHRCEPQLPPSTPFDDVRRIPG